jgi:hypothetical protein
MGPARRVMQIVRRALAPLAPAEWGARCHCAVWRALRDARAAERELQAVRLNGADPARYARGFATLAPRRRVRAYGATQLGGAAHLAPH